MNAKSLCLSLVSIMCFFLLYAEGSRELNNSTNPFARRVFLSQGIGQINGSNWYKITSVDSIEARNNFYVFANIGDSITLATSSLGIGVSSIELIRPDGTLAVFYNTAPGDTGRILAGAGSRNRELQGPFGLYGGGPGYIPRVFVADQQGVYIVRFLSPTPSSTSSASTGFPSLANADFSQPTNNTVIAAFDISIIKNGVLVPGRVYANYMSLTGGALSTGSNPKRYATQYLNLAVLTREGYQYALSLRGLAPYGYFIYTDNVGLQLADGITPAYESIRYQPTQPTNRRILIPDVDPETALETKHKIFFNTPDPSMPATALMNNTNVWLYATLTPATYNVSVNFGLTQIPNPMAGNFTFNIANFGIRYKFVIDLNLNQVFGDSSDVIINNTTVAGTNTINWDGLDGFGNPAAMGCFNVRIEFIGGELHIPLADAENFRGGIQLARLNGNGTLPDYTIHWNDLPLNDNNETAPGRYVKRTPASGVSSQVTPGIDTTIRRWEFQESVPTENYTGIPTHMAVQYGDTRFMDQWAYDTLSSNVFTPLACFFPLPLQLKNFSINKVNSQVVRLDWSIAQRQPETVFYLQRSAGTGESFADIGQINAAQHLHFTFADSFLTNDIYYYRLKWKDADGKYKYSAVKSISLKTEANNKAVVYPNPARDKITIQLPPATGVVQVRIVNLYGQLIKLQHSNTSTISVDVRHLRKGNYVLEILNNKGTRIQAEKISILK